VLRGDARHADSSFIPTPGATHMRLTFAAGTDMNKGNIYMKTMK